LHNCWIEEGREHAGIIVSQQLPVGEALRRWLNFMQVETAEGIRNEVRFF
jgi:hypothetical protein